jgi:uncharacterized protein
MIKVANMQRLFYIVIGFMWVAQGCATYNKRITGYYEAIRMHDFKKANDQLEANKLLKKDRNKILYLLEKGRTAHLEGNYTASNKFFNEADYLMEDFKTSTRDVLVNFTVNPMLSKYKGTLL